MFYIIDANNLAGKLKMLGDENFNKKLIETIKRFNQGKQREIFLVFDGSDPYGDKIEAGENVTVIYSPNDKYYQSADDKIVEVVNNYLNSQKDSLRVVTEDRGLIKRVKNLYEEIDSEVEILGAAGFADKLRQMDNTENDDDSDDDRGLSGEDIKNINDEMLGLWK